MKIDEAMDIVERFRAETVSTKCKTDDDLVMLASQLAYQSAVILLGLGGPRLAAAHFCSMADEYASLAQAPDGSGDRTPPDG